MPPWWITRQERFERIKLISEPESFDCDFLLRRLPPLLLLSRPAVPVPFILLPHPYEVDNFDSPRCPSRVATRRYFISTVVLFNDHRAPRPIADRDTSVRNWRTEWEIYRCPISREILPTQFCVSYQNCRSIISVVNFSYPRTRWNIFKRSFCERNFKNYPRFLLTLIRWCAARLNKIIASEWKLFSSQLSNIFHE